MVIRIAEDSCTDEESLEQQVTFQEVREEGEQFLGWENSSSKDDNV